MTSTGTFCSSKNRHDIGDGIKGFAQRSLYAVGLGQTAFALLAKDLPLEPRYLAAQVHDLVFLFDDFTALLADQLDQFRRRQCVHFMCRIWARILRGIGCQLHAIIIARIVLPRL